MVAGLSEGMWLRRVTVDLILVGLVLTCSVGGPVVSVDRERLQSDSGVVAYLDKVHPSFPRMDGLGNVGIAEGVQLAYDAPRRRLLIADYLSDQLLVVNDQGKVEAILAESSSAASVPAPWMKDCHDVAVDSRGRIFVADIVNKTVWILGPDLSWLGAVPVPPLSDGYPRVVAVDSMDRVIVGLARINGESRVLVFQEDEKSGLMDSVASFKFNPPKEQAYCGIPFDVVVDSEDRIIIAEGSTSAYTLERVHVFDKEFHWVTTFGSAGSKPGQFVSIGSLAIGPDDTIIVSDRRMYRGTVSFFFKNGTYAGRITGLDLPNGLLYAGPWKLLMGNSLPGGAGCAKLVDVDWASLRATETSTDPSPGPGPVPEPLGLAAILVVSGWSFARLARKASKQSSREEGRGKRVA